MIYTTYKTRKGMRATNEQIMLYYKSSYRQLIIFQKHNKRNYNTYISLISFFSFYVKIFSIQYCPYRESSEDIVVSRLNIFSYIALPCTFGNTEIQVFVTIIIYVTVMDYYKLDLRFKHFLYVTRAQNKYISPTTVCNSPYPLREYQILVGISV